ncbi:class C beta-lactamase-related serine hydrolase [Bacillus salacetis]|uniref:Class C beta-lactamase-related serine hydrolase n=1 Tax=Bacillus salacetis TaxID=2315464 RepID=A0A3A1QT24_9BACI|nr:serine hydrolase [Bacillus salacetis]RIW30378.1 class C beta-lactamase-related serine hydrolase [Bacillus salacetis]
MSQTAYSEPFRDLTEYSKEAKERMKASGSAILIMKENEIIHEWYSGSHHFEQGARKIDVHSQFNVYSTRVTYIGLAAAISMHEGYLKLDDKISSYFHDLDKNVLGNTTIRHLVTRCTGLKIKGNSVKRIAEPGTLVESKRPDLLAAIIMQTTGKTVNEIISEKVFYPLGFSHSEWAAEGKNTLVCDIQSPGTYPTIRIGSTLGDDRNLYVNARELALWGQLHLQKGEVNGKQILPRAVFDLAVNIQSPAALDRTLPKFGFYWWMKDGMVSYSGDELGGEVPEGSYQILGASGCACLVIPKYNAVAVRMYNSLHNDGKYDYLHDIRTFGNLAVKG